MATYLWTPPTYEKPPLRVWRNPNESVYEPVPDGMREYDTLITPNGQVIALNGVADDALAQLQAAGPRGAAALGAAAGFIFSGWKAAVIGGALGYFTGKYLANFASKALAAAKAVTAVETTVTKATT